MAKLPHDPQLTRNGPIGQRIIEIRKDGSYYDDLVYLHIDLNTKFVSPRHVIQGNVRSTSLTMETTSAAPASSSRGTGE